MHKDSWSATCTRVCVHFSEPRDVPFSTPIVTWVWPHGLPNHKSLKINDDEDDVDDAENDDDGDDDDNNNNKNSGGDIGIR